MEEQRLIRRRESLWHAWPKIAVGLGLPVFWWHAEHLTVTDRRVILRRGLFSKDERQVRLENVLDVRVKQGMFGRLFGHGTLAIETAGSGGTEFVFKGLRHPGKVRDVIMAAVDDAKARERAEERRAMAEAVAQARRED